MVRALEPARILPQLSVLCLRAGTLRPRNNGTLQGELIHFDQSEFLHNPRHWSLDDTAYVFIPKQCKEGQRCKVCRCCSALAAN